MILEVPPNPTHPTAPITEQTQLWICPNSPQTTRSVQAQSFTMALAMVVTPGLGGADPAMPIWQCQSSGAGLLVLIQQCRSSGANPAVSIWQC